MGGRWGISDSELASSSSSCHKDHASKIWDYFKGIICALYHTPNPFSSQFLKTLVDSICSMYLIRRANREVKMYHGSVGRRYVAVEEEITKCLLLQLPHQKEKSWQGKWRKRPIYDWVVFLVKHHHFSPLVDAPIYICCHWQRGFIANYLDTLKKYFLITSTTGSGRVFEQQIYPCWTCWWLWRRWWRRCNVERFRRYHSESEECEEDEDGEVAGDSEDKDDENNDGENDDEETKRWLKNNDDEKRGRKQLDDDDDYDDDGENNDDEGR